MGNISRNWVAALVMSLVIAFSAGTLLSTALMLVPGIPAPILALPMQAVVFVTSALLLVRIESPQLRWGWGCLAAGLVLLLTIPCIVLIAVLDAGTAGGLAADRDSATALFFVLLIFGLPLLGAALAFLVTSAVLFRKARSE